MHLEKKHLSRNTVLQSQTDTSEKSWEQKKKMHKTVDLQHSPSQSNTGKGGLSRPWVDILLPQVITFTVGEKHEKMCLLLIEIEVCVATEARLCRRQRTSGGKS